MSICFGGMAPDGQQVFRRVSQPPRSWAGVVALAQEVELANVKGYIRRGRGGVLTFGPPEGELVLPEQEAKLSWVHPHFRREHGKLEQVSGYQTHVMPAAHSGERDLYNRPLVTPLDIPYTRAHDDAIDWYRREGLKVNKALREGTQLQGKAAEHVAALDDLLAHVHPLARPMTVYRGRPSEDGEHLPGGFVSTTNSEAIARSFGKGRYERIHLPAGIRAFVFPEDPDSRYSGELEVLLPRHRQEGVETQLQLPGIRATGPLVDFAQELMGDVVALSLLEPEALGVAARPPSMGVYDRPGDTIAKTGIRHPGDTCSRAMSGCRPGDVISGHAFRRFPSSGIAAGYPGGTAAVYPPGQPAYQDESASQPAKPARPARRAGSAGVRRNKGRKPRR